MFSVVLDYLRSGRLFVPPGLTAEYVEAELRHWQISGTLTDVWNNVVYLYRPPLTSVPFENSNQRMSAPVDWEKGFPVFICLAVKVCPGRQALCPSRASLHSVA